MALLVDRCMARYAARHALFRDRPVTRCRFYATPG
jgi:hypothetical protein